MMINQTIYIATLLFALLVVSGCQKEQVIEEQFLDPLPARWEQFVGTYDVYDPYFEEEYEMSISYIGEGLDVFGLPNDSLKIENFANRFDLRIEFRHFMADENLLDFILPLGILDQNGNRFNVLLNSETSTEYFPEFQANSIRKDTLIVSAMVNNIPYFIEDDTTLTAINFDHLAVKK